MSGLNFNPLAFALTKIQGICPASSSRSQKSNLKRLLRFASILIALLQPSISFGQSNFKSEPTEVINFGSNVHLEWPINYASSLTFNLVKVFVNQEIKDVPQSMVLMLEWAESDSTIWKFAAGGMLDSYGVEVDNAPGYAKFSVDFKKMNGIPTNPLFAIQCIDYSGNPTPARYAARHGIVITINIDFRYSSISEQKTVQFVDENFMPHGGHASSKWHHSPRELQIWNLNGQQLGQFHSDSPNAEKEALSTMPRGMYLIVDPSKEDKLPTRKVVNF